MFDVIARGRVYIKNVNGMIIENCQRKRRLVFRKLERKQQRWCPPVKEHL